MGNDNKHYKGNPNLKAENVSIEFTEEQISEYLKCKIDPVYFTKNYVKIVSLDKGLVPFDLYGFQKKISEFISGAIIILISNVCVFLNIYF